MNLIKCYLTQSMWYNTVPHNGRPVGILWHDTCGGNTRISRYVQPSDNEPNREELIKILGKNVYNNDWNHNPKWDCGINAVVGLLGDDKTVATCMTSEESVYPWGCWHGENGSCNGYRKINGANIYDGRFWFQFEICDDGYFNKNYKAAEHKEYFDKVYKEACELTAYICKKYDIDPFGTVDWYGTQVPTILCHGDTHVYGMGNGIGHPSPHSDIYPWFEKFGKSMEDVKVDVANILGIPVPEQPEKFARGDKINIREGVTKWANGNGIAGWLFDNYDYLYVISSNSETSVITCDKTLAAASGTIFTKDIVHYVEPAPEPQPCPEPEPEPEPAPDPEPAPEPKPSLWVRIISAIINWLTKLLDKT